MRDEEVTRRPAEIAVQVRKAPLGFSQGETRFFTVELPCQLTAGVPAGILPELERSPERAVAIHSPGRVLEEQRAQWNLISSTLQKLWRKHAIA